MLAVAGTLPPDEAAWAFELKWDGIRAVAHWDGEPCGSRPATCATSPSPTPSCSPWAPALGRTPARPRRRGRGPRRRRGAELPAASRSACTWPTATPPPAGPASARSLLRLRRPPLRRRATSCDRPWTERRGLPRGARAGRAVVGHATGLPGRGRRHLARRPRPAASRASWPSASTAPTSPGERSQGVDQGQGHEAATSSWWAAGSPGEGRREGHIGALLRRACPPASGAPRLLRRGRHRLHRRRAAPARRSASARCVTTTQPVHRRRCPGRDAVFVRPRGGGRRRVPGAHDRRDPAPALVQGRAHRQDARRREH